MLQDKNFSLELSDIHKQWYLQNEKETVPENYSDIPNGELFDEIQQLMIQANVHQQEIANIYLKRAREALLNDVQASIAARGKGRPPGSQNIKRDPCAFEHVDAGEAKKRKCGRCGFSGHNSRTCWFCHNSRTKIIK
jgi:hypothetical protein